MPKSKKKTSSGYNADPEIVLDVAAVEEAVPLVKEVQQTIDPMKTGFFWYVPPLSSEVSHTTGGQEWCVAGHDMQVLTMTVPPGETITTEVGSMMYMHPNMETEVECDLFDCRRICGGESCVKLLLKNPSQEQGYLGLTPNFPAKIIPIKFGTHVSKDSHLIARPGAFLAQLGDVDVGCDLDCSLGTCCCAGIGLCRQKLEGAQDSIAFLNAGGTIVYKHLKPGEKVTIDSDSVVGFESTNTLGIAFNGKFCTCCFGGEGCFSTTLEGPGRVYMQSMSFNRFQAAVSQTITDRGDSSAATGAEG
mmetsp:Transcript_30029/g.72892  ORF Transcript_30029/g.72892 Transcript_30029/m.72892 type:complete len:304 (+) Transcript_30029:110-1021(+)